MFKIYVRDSLDLRHIEVWAFEVTAPDREAVLSVNENADLLGVEVRQGATLFDSEQHNVKPLFRAPIEFVYGMLEGLNDWARRDRNLPVPDPEARAEILSEQLDKLQTRYEAVMDRIIETVVVMAKNERSADARQ